MSNKQAQAAKLPSKDEMLKQFNQVEVKLTDVENQLIVDTERRKAMLINNVATMFAEELQHIVAMFAKKKNVAFDQELFAGVFYDATKGKAFIMQYKSKADKDAAVAAANPQAK